MITSQIILDNTFFAFWFLLGEYFVAICSVILFYTLVLSLYWLVVKR